MFYSTLVGEEPDSVLVKKEGKQNQVKMIRYGSPLLLAPKILPFPKELGLHFFSISIQEFLSVSTPFFWDLETWNGQIPSLRNTYKKKDNVTLPLTTSFSFMNFIVIEIHVLPRQNLELAILLPNRQRLTSVERLIHSDRYEDPTPLHCQNPCSIFEAGWPLCFSHGTILFLLSPLSPRSTEKKCRTGADSSSRKKELTEPGSLTNRIVLLTNTNI